VLEVRSSAAQITRDNARFLTDVVRQVALQANPEAEMMTRENLLVLLDSTGKKLEDCEGECEVETGRRLGAESVISGDLGRLGTKFNLSLRLHDTRSGRLLASATGSAASGDELEASFQRASRELFSGDLQPTALPRAAEAPRCRSDIECPGDEVCTPRGCALDPAPASGSAPTSPRATPAARPPSRPPAAAPARCTSDIDCRSDQVCTPQGCELTSKVSAPAAR
jgi:hypothetical protein